MTQTICILLLLFVITSCNLENRGKPLIELYVLPDPTHSHQLFVDGQLIEVSDLEELKKRRFSKRYTIYKKGSKEPDQRLLEIKSSNGVEYKTEIKSGSYVVNLSKQHSVSLREFSYVRAGYEGYGSPSFTPLSGKGFGSHYINSELGLRVFDFGYQPPISFESKGGLAGVHYLLISDTITEESPFYDLIVFKESTFDVSIINFWDKTFSPQKSAGGDYAPHLGIKHIKRFPPIKGYEIVGIGFFLSATEAQRQDVYSRIKSSPIVYKLMKNVPTKEIDKIGESLPEPKKRIETQRQTK